MSTKSHFLYEQGIECYEETSEPQSIFGRFTGYNLYVIVDFTVLESIKLEGEYLYLLFYQNNFFPRTIKIWGDAVVSFELNDEGICLILKGGHPIAKEFFNKEFHKLAP
jgi:hypothetical protein